MNVVILFNDYEFFVPFLDLPDWINAVGLLLSYLPDVFFDGLKKRLVTALTSAPLSQWNLPQNPFEMFNFNVVHRCVFLRNCIKDTYVFNMKFLKLVHLISEKHFYYHLPPVLNFL